MANPPDESAALEGLWIQQIAKGDRAAFERLYLAYQRPLFRYFLHFVSATGAAEELVDDVMLEVWKGARRFRGKSRPSVWLFGIAYHKAIDALRRRKPAPVELRAVENAVADPQQGPDASAVRENVRRDVAAALASLSAEHRAVVVLTFVLGYSYAEIAQTVGCPVNTVKTRMFYAKRQLRDALDRRGLRREIS